MAKPLRLPFFLLVAVVVVTWPTCEATNSYLVTPRGTRSQAQAYCHHFNYELVSIHSYAELDELTTWLYAVHGQNQRVWIGALTTPHGWTWFDGSTFDFANWHDGFDPSASAATDLGIAVDVEGDNKNLWYPVHEDVIWSGVCGPPYVPVGAVPCTSELENALCAGERTCQVLDGIYECCADNICAPPSCSEQEGNRCHVLTSCSAASGTGECTCPEGMQGNGIGEVEPDKDSGCNKESWSVRTVFNLPSLNASETTVDGKLRSWESLQVGLARVFHGFASSDTSGDDSIPRHFLTSMHHTVATHSMGGFQLTVSSLFRNKNVADAAAQMMEFILHSGPVELFGVAINQPGDDEWQIDPEALIWGPRTYSWVAKTTAAEFQVKATGLTVDAVHFQPNCEQSGCWVVDITFAVGEDNFNVLYIPNAVGDDSVSFDYDYTQVTAHPWTTWSKSAATTFQPNNFPCGSSDYVPTDGTANPPAKVTACCIPEFLDLFRPVASFNSVPVSKAECDSGRVPMFYRPGFSGQSPPQQPLEVMYAPYVRNGLQLRHVDGRALKWDRGSGMVRLNSGEDMSLDILAPPRSDSTRSYERTDYVALKHSSEDRYFRHGGYVLHMDPWATYVSQTEGSSSLLAYDFAWKFLDQGDDTFVIFNDFGGGWYLGYDAGSDLLRIVPSGDARILHVSIDGVLSPSGAPLPMPSNAVEGLFAGMEHASVVSTGIVDPYLGIHQARLLLDEVELRNKAGMLQGTVGVEHTVETFVGMANFKPTGITFLDSAAYQVAIHLEKTSFFSVSTHGTNDYTLLQYVNLRLVAIYDEDNDPTESEAENGDRSSRTNSTMAAHYLQVTFTLGTQYQPNQNSGIIPLDSVRVGKGEFYTSPESGFTHTCSLYTSNSPDFPRETFDSRLPQPDGSQSCAPHAVMCHSPPSTPDHFVAFNVPLGIDWLPSASASLASNVFLDMIVSVVDQEQIGVPNASPNAGAPPEQMKTRLTASISVVEGGINIFCDGITAKTDLKDVANADIIIGSAGLESEMGRLRILQDVASSDLQPTGPQRIDTDSIESGLITLVVKGNSSYFSRGGSGAFGIQVEDVITIHIMESEAGSSMAGVTALLADAGDDNSNPDGLDTSGYKLNGAFRFVVDRADQRAFLEPTDALVDLCPFSPRRPTAGDAFPSTCVLRRDVRRQSFPSREGGVATAVELPAANVAVLSAERDGVATFMQSVLGASEYAAELGRNFSYLVARRYELNGQHNRAFWINPGYEWTPTQTGGKANFFLSQKMALFALITLDEGFASSGDQVPPTRRRVGHREPRRMLMSSVADSGSSVSSTRVEFSTSPSSMLASAFSVPESMVSTLRVQLSLSEEQACAGPQELHTHLRSTLDEYLQRSASAFETVELLSVLVDREGLTCRRRNRPAPPRRVLSSPSATAEVLVVFAASVASPYVDLELLATMPDVDSIFPVAVSGAVGTTTPQHHGTDRAQQSETVVSSDSTSNLTLVAAIGGGVGSAFLLAVGMFALSRRTQQVERVDALSAVQICDLKGELALELKAELASS